jgi:hypothetical protein
MKYVVRIECEVEVTVDVSAKDDPEGDVEHAAGEAAFSFLESLAPRHQVNWGDMTVTDTDLAANPTTEVS